MVGMRAAVGVRGCLQFVLYTVANAACLLPPPLPSPTGEGAVLRQIQITAAVSHMDSYETVAIFAANKFPLPVGDWNSSSAG